MSRRPLAHPVERLAKAQSRMAPGGLLWSESPIPRRYSPRVLEAGEDTATPPPPVLQEGGCGCSGTYVWCAADGAQFGPLASITVTLAASATDPRLNIRSLTGPWSEVSWPYATWPAGSVLTYTPVSGDPDYAQMWDCVWVRVGGVHVALSSVSYT